MPVITSQDNIFVHTSKYKVIQHVPWNQLPPHDDEGCHYKQLLEIKDAPPGKPSFVFRIFLPSAGSVCFGFKDLPTCFNAILHYLGSSKKIDTLPGFISKELVPPGITPWFYES